MLLGCKPAIAAMSIGAGLCLAVCMRLGSGGIRVWSERADNGPLIVIQNERETPIRAIVTPACKCLAIASEGAVVVGGGDTAVVRLRQVSVPDKGVAPVVAVSISGEATRVIPAPIGQSR